MKITFLTIPSCSESTSNYVYSLAWYDYDLVAYQKERTVTDLEKTFDERNQHIQEHGGIDLNAEHLKKKLIKGEQPDWQKSVKGKKSQEYYSKLQNLESDQILKEQRNREQNHQFAIPGDSAGKTSLAKGMASQYENQL
jgi:titin